MTTHEKYPLPLILFDSECDLCVRFKQTFERLPGSSQFHFVSLHDEDIYEAYPSLNKEECAEVVHLLDHNGEIHQGSEAISYLIHHFPTVKKFAWLIETGMGKKALDYFYIVANKTREKLQKRCGTCNKEK